MKLLATICLASLLAASESIDVFGGTWDVQSAHDWLVERDLLQLKVPAEPPPGQPRRPTKYALLESKPYSRVTLEADIKRDGRSLIVIYAWQDEAHYDYAHISVD